MLCNPSFIFFSKLSPCSFWWLFVFQEIKEACKVFLSNVVEASYFNDISPDIREGFGSKYTVWTVTVSNKCSPLDTKVSCNYPWPPHTSPSPRWRFVSAAFPHVMHCAASLLQYRYNQHKNSHFQLRIPTLAITTVRHSLSHSVSDTLKHHFHFVHFLVGFNSVHCLKYFQHGWI